MSGIQMALLGSVSDGSYIVNVGKSELNGKVNIDNYGFLTSSLQSTPGSITPTGATFKGVTIVAVYSSGVTVGNANSYYVYFQGNQSAGFFNTLKVNGTTVAGTTGSPNYDGTNTNFQITLTLSPAATLFGTTVGDPIPIIMT